MPRTVSASRTPRRPLDLRPVPLAALVACGGSTAPPPVPDSPVPPARAAFIGPAGGTLDVDLGAGYRLRLVVPPGAVGAADSVRAIPERTPAGTVTAFRLEPAGLMLRRSAALTVSRVGTDARFGIAARIAYRSNGITWLQPSTLTTGGTALQLETRRLGARLSGTVLALEASAANAAFAEGSIVVVEPTYAVARSTLATATTIAAATPTAELLEGLQETGAALVRGWPDSVRADAGFAQAAGAWRTAVCTRRAVVGDSVSVFGNVDDVVGFTRLLREVLLVGRLTRELPALLQPVGLTGCTTPFISDGPLVATQLTRFRERSASLAAAANALTEYPRLRANGVTPWFALADLLDRFDGYPGQSAEARLAPRPILDRLRLGAWLECRATPASQRRHQDLLQLFRADSLVRAAATYDADVLLLDASRCGFDFSLRLRRADGSTGDPVAVTPLLPDDEPVSPVLPASGFRRLLTEGRLAAALCPSGATPTVPLAIDVLRPGGAARAAYRIPPQTDGRYLLPAGGLPLDSLSRLAGLADTGLAVFDIFFAKAGPLCGAEFAPGALESVSQLVRVQFRGPTLDEYAGPSLVIRTVRSGALGSGTTLDTLRTDARAWVVRDLIGGLLRLGTAPSTPITARYVNEACGEFGTTDRRFDEICSPEFGVQPDGAINAGFGNDLPNLTLNATIAGRLAGDSLRVTLVVDSLVASPAGRVTRTYQFSGRRIRGVQAP